MKFLILILINLIGNKNVQLNKDLTVSLDLKYSKTSLDSNWYLIKIDSICRFSFPLNRLEFQNVYHRRTVDSILKEFNLTNHKKVVLQQKGFNDFKNGNYTRVLVEVINGSKDEFLKRNTKVKSFTNEEIVQIKNSVKSNYINNLKKVNIKIIKWHNVSITEINNSFCIRSKYDRQSAVDPLKLVTVDVYSFYDSNRIIDLTFSCMKDDYINWNGDFEKIVKSFSLITQE
jgi:ribosomal protein L20